MANSKMPDGKRIFRFYRPVLSTKFPFPRRLGMMSPIRPSHNLNVSSAGKHLFPLFILRSEVSTRLGTGHRRIYQRPARITILFMFFFRDLLFPCGVIIMLLIFYSRSRN